MRKAFVKTIPKRSEKEQLDDLLAWGIDAKDIYIDGHGAESLSACVAAFRGRPGELLIAADLRVFGESRKAILDTAAMLGRLKITVGDIHSGETSLPMLLDEALSQLASQSRAFASRKTAVLTGRKGGQNKGAAQEAKRAEVANPDVVRRLCAHPKLTWKDRSDILGGPPFSVGTLRRRYGPK